MDDALSALYSHLSEALPHSDRPYLTLTFAQALDGSISVKPGVKTTLSGDASLTMTHKLRTLHDGILVGIGTVLADDPQLTARGSEGSDPQAIIVDSRLRTPPDCTLVTGDLKPWIACAPDVDPERKSQLQSLGVEIMHIPQNNVERLDLAALARALRERGVDRLMVEGGARIIHSFLQSDLVDLVVITLAPRMMNGVRPYDAGPESRGFPELTKPRWAPAGDDMVLWARPSVDQR